MSKKYRTAKLEESLLARVQALADDVRRKGTDLLPEELQSMFNGGASQSVILDAGIHLLEKAWKQAKEDLERRRAGER